ncbi:hypothetical protein [Candidatus Viridilinea mediisalina]|uniref:Uncharacterized protein n=1 Tax=Candidatus Viridilinea mediisalina TaxID=2024553 RepID=A0A2A6RP61_9CHLR|nr:hypothetical protein [Candidatus Viridilinea mediisalina]PDW04884.1 hypothetical protein CJ255_01375 [Candidatus Viridilinea mediisalina]
MSKPDDQRSISRTYRAAIRLGEDYITLEETITLPLDASPEEVQQAVALGWQIYQAQREAVEQQVITIRETHVATPVQMRDPDGPASDKQRSYIATLQDHLAWSNEQLAGYAADRAIDFMTMTKGQASNFIDDLKKLADERVRYSAEGRGWGRSSETQSANQAASARQLQALTRIAEQQGLDLEATIEQRFGINSSELSNEQAGLLLQELQPRPARASRREDAAKDELE